ESLDHRTPSQRAACTSARRRVSRASPYYWLNRGATRCLLSGPALEMPRSALRQTEAWIAPDRLAASGLSTRLHVVRPFTVRGDVEALSFFFFRNSQSHDRLDHQESDGGDHRSPHDHQHHGFELDDELWPDSRIADRALHPVLDRTGAAK